MRVHTIPVKRRNHYRDDHDSDDDAHHTGRPGKEVVAVVVVEEDTHLHWNSPDNLDFVLEHMGTQVAAEVGRLRMVTEEVAVQMGILVTDHTLK